MPKAAKPWARAVASRRCSSEGRVSESIAALYDKAACVPYILSAIEDQHLTEFSVEARGLTKYFEGFAAADHVTLEVPAGSIYGVLGPNGEIGRASCRERVCQYV